MDRRWRTDRISAYEAPRPKAPERKQRNITLTFRGQQSEKNRTVIQIPADMPMPDVISYRGHLLVPRQDGTYAEATVWPIVEALDANAR